MKKTSFHPLVASSFILISLSLACSSAPKGGSGAKNLTDAPSQGSKQTPGGIPWIGSINVHRGTLDNGLKYLVIEDFRSPTFAYHTWFNVGSRDEQVKRTGLAHLFEHMMFKGTAKYPQGQFDGKLEAAGVEGLNAFTSHDYTAYVQELPDDKLDLIAELESDRMRNLIVNDESFKTEVLVVQNERRARAENSPDGLMLHALFALTFTKHPYTWPVIGHQEDLDSMTAQDAEAFYKSHYAPNNATVVIVGAVTLDQAKRTLQKYYGKLPKVELQRIPIEPEPPQTGLRRKRMPLNIQVEKIMMSFHIPNVEHEDTPALAMIQSVLSSGNSSRLHQSLVETGIATGAYAEAMENKDPGMFVVGATLQRGKSAAQAESVLVRELEKLSKSPVGQDELERAKNQMSFGLYEAMSSAGSLARILGSSEAVGGGFEKATERFYRTLKVTPQEIQAVAAKYLKPKLRNVVTGVPK